MSTEENFDFREREDGKEVSSEVLNNLPEPLIPKENLACHVCPNAVWFTDCEDLTEPRLNVFCMIMRSIIWQSTESKTRIFVRQCDGMNIVQDEE
ncbi:hypothetical protein BTN33_22705 [Aeromonas veronii]|nr:hypothetical protein BTN33_22705 [Aeromonas veronii]